MRGRHRATSAAHRLLDDSDSQALGGRRRHVAHAAPRMQGGGTLFVISRTPERNWQRARAPSLRRGGQSRVWDREAWPARQGNRRSGRHSRPESRGANDRQFDSGSMRCPEYPHRHRCAEGPHLFGLRSGLAAYDNRLGPSTMSMIAALGFVPLDLSRADHSDEDAVVGP